MTVEWRLYRKCPVCFAALGTACLSQSGSFSQIERDRPHSRRLKRKGLR